MASDLQATWESRISRALRVKDDWMQEFRVQMGRDYFEGRQNPGWPDHEWITVNKIYSHMKARLPNLYRVDPFFYVKVRRSFSPNPLDIAMFEERGRIRQSYLNYLKEELTLKAKARLAIQDAHFAFGVLKTHYSADQLDNPSAGEPIMDSAGDQMLSDEGEPIVEPDSLMVNEKYNWSRVHPDDFLWDEDAGTLPDKWNWLAERIVLTPEQAKKDKRNKRDVLKTAPTKSSGAEKKGEGKQGGFFSSLFNRGTQDRPEVDGERQVHVGWEIYDLEHGEWLRIITGAEAPVIEPQSLPTGIEDHPYDILRFTLRDNSPMPIPPVSQGLDPQRELNLSRSRIMRHRKRFNRKYEVFVEGLEDPDFELAKLESGDDGIIIRKRTHQRLVDPIQDAPLDPQTYQELAHLNNDLVEALGQSDAARGVASADSATEAAIIDRNLDMREGDEMSAVTDWIAGAAKSMDQLVQANISRDEAVRVSGPRGEFWELVKSSDFEAINGEFEYTVNVGSTIPRLPQIERAQLIAYLQLLATMPHLLLAKRTNKRVFEMHHLEDESILEELEQLGKKMMSGAMAPPGAQGSQPGVPESNPIAAVIGAALGQQGGATNGGGGMEAA